jgi:hypothetical protein
MRKLRLGLTVALCLQAGAASAAAPAQNTSTATTVGDGGRGFDFVIGDWKAHLRRRIDPKTGVTASEPGQGVWVDYYGISNHKKLLGTNANLEEFDVTDSKNHLHYKGQTLRMYNPASKQWSIYGVDLDKGEIAPSALTGSFTGKDGIFYHQEERGGRIMLVRYVWTDKGPKSAVMVQSFSPDGGKTWDANWICELSR